MTEQSSGNALVRTLEVVQRAVVVVRVVPRYELVSLHREVCTREIREQTGRDRRGTGAGIAAAAAQRTGADITIAVEDLVDLAEAEVAGHVATTVARIDTHDHVDVNSLTVSRIAGCLFETILVDQVLHEGVAVVVRVSGILIVYFETFVVVLHDEVDNAGDSIGAVD